MHGKDCLREQEVNSLLKQSAKLSMFVGRLVGFVLACFAFLKSYYLADKVCYTLA